MVELVGLSINIKWQWFWIMHLWCNNLKCVKSSGRSSNSHWRCWCTHAAAPAIKDQWQYFCMGILCVCDITDLPGCFWVFSVILHWTCSWHFASSTPFSHSLIKSICVFDPLPSTLCGADLFLWHLTSSTLELFVPLIAAHCADLSRSQSCCCLLTLSLRKHIQIQIMNKHKQNDSQKGWTHNIKKKLKISVFDFYLIAFLFHILKFIFITPVIKCAVVQYIGWCTR